MKLNKIAKGYNLGKVISSNEIIGGYNSRNYDLLTSKGHFFIRKFVSHRQKDQIKLELNFLDYLKNERFPCVPALRTTEGDLYLNTLEGNFALFEWQASEPYDNQLESTALCLSQLHKLSTNYKRIVSGRDCLDKCFDNDIDCAKKILSGNDIIHQSNLPICHPLKNKELFKINEINKINIRRLFKEYFNNFIVPKANEYSKIVSLFEYSSFNKPIIHGDFIARNISYKNEAVFCVYDFDSMREDVLAADLAISIFDFCLDTKKKETVFNQKKLSAFIDAYKSKLPITKKDIKLMKLTYLNGALNLFFFGLNHFFLKNDNRYLNLLNVSEKLASLYSNPDTENQLCEATL
ncbi:phosphotransferase [Candidatus Woesearchaeota archaeon]|jgi:Ser/Thr protein kinase RdoA (MazF antagonist)|nr:phosphotransferase [Candidatus Woesearchaeota archaeon]MBT6519352.1 phosphotransferase [Candidatus Woesearchaeota archaeon]